MSTPTHIKTSDGKTSVAYTDHLTLHLRTLRSQRGKDPLGPGSYKESKKGLVSQSPFAPAIKFGVAI